MSEVYDPNALEGETPRGSQYMSKKDVRNILVVLVFLMIALFPIYKVMEKNSEKARCVQNMRSIFGALQQYATAFDEQYPVVYEGIDSGEPAVDGRGVTLTWANAISQYMNDRSNFLCPSATAEEAAIVATDPQRKVKQDLKPHPTNTELLSYGFYSAYSTFATTSIVNPSTLIIIAETSNRGAKGTYDPTPFKGDDAFAIGWDNSNKVPNATTKAVTRLAFQDLVGTDFAAATPRHQNGINALAADGSLKLIKPEFAAVTQGSTGIGGLWTPPASFGRSNQ